MLWRASFKLNDLPPHRIVQLQQFDASGRRHMECVKDHGPYDDLPQKESMDDFGWRYPKFSEHQHGWHGRRIRARNALLTTEFADPIRDAIGGGKAWISSSGKPGGAGVAIDVPLAHKDALYVRSHYDTMTLYFSAAPGAREVVVIFAVATRGRIQARLGGLAEKDTRGADVLR